MPKMIEGALDRLREIPHLDWGHYPTPLEELPRLRASIGTSCPHLLIKRDDLTGPGFGGNKVRKLEYLFAQAVADDAEVAITVGGEKSNHARITAALAARLGIRAILVLNSAAPDDSENQWTPASLALDRLFGAEVHLVKTREERLPTMQAIARELRSQGRRVIEIPLGASVPLGALGYVRAAQELAAQLAARSVSLDYIFHASSSGGTQAGLQVGCQLAGIDAQIIGVSPDDPSGTIAAEVRTIMRGLAEMLGLSNDSLKDDVTVIDDFIGPGYGLASAESDAALSLLARTEGVVLDPVYTAKAMTALLAWISEGRLSKRETALFWHTGGQMALFYTEKSKGKRQKAKGKNEE